MDVLPKKNWVPLDGAPNMKPADVVDNGVAKGFGVTDGAETDGVEP